MRGVTYEETLSVLKFLRAGSSPRDQARPTLPLVELEFLPEIETAFAGVVPKEQARIANEEKARLRSLVGAIV
jgi:hypothetical protein